jgi:sodium pump decarboxylase gamma subunit
MQARHAGVTSDGKFGRRAFVGSTDYSVVPIDCKLPHFQTRTAAFILETDCRTQTMGYQNILDANGFGLAIVGMTIVFFVLVLVSLFIAAMPRLLPIVNSILPVVEHHHGAPMPSAARPAAASAEEEVVAAIGVALHHHNRGR